uniref:Acyl-CoA thioester hydrolase/bile acid-CoA amino acid N-acetyltransferase domain-containing protein n=1 Tax=Branchiostoma floridae TaxID=7739 RepID=C3XZ98_BRAFL|eukprot:XP_002610652.1 hypothetical protein BRAFLDRAFT_117893 [Branchiostoma floridae]
MASIAVSPPTSLVTDKVDIRVTGLGKQQPVTLTAAVQYSRDAQFQSHAHYAADSSGSVVCSRHAAVGGSFSGVEQMGLLWSLQPAAAQRVKRMIPRDVTKPLEVQLCVYDGHIDTRRGQDGVPAPLASCVVERRFIRDGVRRIVVREGRVRGVLYLPEEEGPFPGVIDMYGSGANFEHRAALLSCQGFAAFRLMYCNFDDLPKAETHLDSEYFTDAVDWFSSHSLVQPGGVGVVGTSFGGLLALIMGTLTDKAIARMEAHGKTNHQLLAYPGAGHLLEPPYMPHCKISFHPIPGAEVDWGGETRAHCAAQEDLWPRMIAFLRNSRLHSQL